MTRKELMADDTQYCCYCGQEKVRFHCCGENHFQTFAQMDEDEQEEFLQDGEEQMIDRFLMKQALDTLKKAVSTCFDQYSHDQVMSYPDHFVTQTLTNLRLRLEQAVIVPEWVGLTDEEVEQIVDGNTHDDQGYQLWCSGKGVAEAVEAKLKEKNYERRV